MVNIRKHVSTCLLLFVLTLIPSFVFAIGLGELRIQSYLNQPFEAEIPIVDLNGIDPSDIVVMLADKTAYEKENLEIVGWINHIRFKVVKKDKNKAVIKLSTQKPIQEPYGDLLIQVAWSNEKLVREYAVLLDPQPLSSKKALFTEQLASQLPHQPSVSKERDAKQEIKAQVEEDPQKPLKLVAPIDETVKTKSSRTTGHAPENVVQRLALIEESLDTLKRTNETISLKNQQLQSQNETLASMLAAKEAEIIRLKQSVEKKPPVAEVDPFAQKENPFRAAPIEPEHHVIAIPDPTVGKKASVAKPLTSQNTRLAKLPNTVDDKQTNRDFAFILFILAFLGSLLGWIWYSRDHIKNFLMMLSNFLNKSKKQSLQKEDVDLKELDLPGFGLQIDLEKALSAINTQGKTPVKEQSFFDLSEAENEVQKKSQTLLHDAEIYIAYERYQQAETLLKEILAIETVKDLFYWEASLKLLELYVLTEKYEDFKKWHSKLSLEEIPPLIASKINVLQEKVQTEMTIQPQEIKQEKIEKEIVTEEIENHIPLKLSLVKEDEIQAQLSRSKAYIEVGNKIAAKNILEEILPQAEGQQKEEIQKLLIDINPK